MSILHLSQHYLSTAKHMGTIACSLALLLLVCHPAKASFFHATGNAGVRAGFHFDNPNQDTEGTYHAIEKHFHLGLEIKPGDLTSLYMTLRFAPLLAYSYLGAEVPEESEYTDQYFYHPLDPSVTELYFESATRYCLFSVGRRARHVGLGIFIHDGTGPFDTHQSLFEGISCDINTGSWRQLGITVGYDKLREDIPFEKGDDAHQFFAAVSYDDRHFQNNAPLKKQVGLYFALVNSDSPHTFGKNKDRYLDIFGGLYWGYLSLEAEGLLRMGTASGTSWEKIGARERQDSDINAFAFHSKLTFSYPPLYPLSAHASSAPEDDSTEADSDSAGEEETEDEENTAAQMTANEGEDEEEAEAEEYANEDLEDAYDDDEGEEEENEDGSSEQELAAGTSSADGQHQSADATAQSADATIDQEQTQTPLTLAQASALQSSTNTLTSRHEASLLYTFAPGDLHGYYMGEDRDLSLERRNDTVQALPLHYNFKPAMILFNFKTNTLDIDGIYSGNRVINAHVFAAKYSFLHSLYGNIHFKVIGAIMDKRIPSRVASYFTQYEPPDDYYRFAYNQKYPVGQFGAYLGTELNLHYDIALSDLLNWGLGIGYLLTGNALDVASSKNNIFALESSLVLSF